MHTVLELINRTTEFFKQKGVPNPKLDTELLLAHVLKCKRLQLYLEFERMVEEPTLEKLRPMVRRRGEREPLQYILGNVEWGNVVLKVDKRCLVPRNETEELWEHIIDESKIGARKPRNILDLGTGSGALALALKKSYPDSKVTAVEKNPDTLQLALENAKALGLEIDFVEGSWCERLPKDTKFDLIVSNPPYLTEAEVASVNLEVSKWEPREAIYAPDEGFADIAEVMRQAKGHLEQNSELWLETGIAHAGRVKILAEELGYKAPTHYKDHAGRNRFVRLRLR